MSSSDPVTSKGSDQSSESSTEKRQEDETKEAEGDEEEEAGECGFCLFMKGGGCKDAFIAWENCIEEAEKSKEDIVEKCFEVTGALKKCMEAHADYYEPILRAEKAQEEEAAEKSDKEKADEKSDSKETTIGYSYEVSEEPSQ